MRVKSILNLAGIIVAGDFNGRHGNWGDKKDNQQGKKLVDLVENLKLNVWSKYVGNSFQCSEGGMLHPQTLKCRECRNLG